MEARTRSWLQTGVILAVLAAVVALGWRERRRFAPVGPGERAPAYAAPSLAGDTVSLESLHGRVVLLNVWATWCEPCRWEMPAIERLHREYRDRGLEVVAVSVDVAPGGVEALRAPDGPVARMAEELGLTFRILLDPAGDVQDRFGVVGLPTTFLIDRDGRIVERFLGPARWDEPPHLDRVRRILGS